MSTQVTIRDAELDALREVVNIASGHAATALSQLTDRRIMITVPDFAVATLEEVIHLLGYAKSKVAVVAMHILGDVTGSLVFLMPEHKARHLSAMLLGGAAEAGGVLSPMARSSLTETANILAGAYTGALATLTQRLVMLSVPVFGIEPPDGILAQQWASGRGDQLALCIETKLTFDDDGTSCGGHMLLLPRTAALTMILETLQVGR